MTTERSRPKRSLGQNFLVDPNYRRKIVDVVPYDSVDTVVEIGPGRGAITEGLLAHASSLVVVEKDPKLASIWLERARSDGSLSAVEGDILDQPVTRFGDPERIAVVGNIPYNVTTPILFHLLERPRPFQIILMVQREVAERLSAEPGTKEYGALSVGVRAVATVETLFRVPATAFRPRPRVESAVIRIVPHTGAALDEDDEVWLRRITRAVFQWRRKQLVKTLRDHPDLALGLAAEAVLESIGVPPKTRPEALSPDQFVALVGSVRSLRPAESTRAD